MTDMTMGQRIAERRKKLNLSQEALGEKMGISRQAISKWESDGTVPDVDKLIALSKLFGVTVGWLLGVEEEPEDPAGAEFTEAQLKLVEEIVRRYQPQPLPEKKAVPLWIRILAAAAVAVVAWTAFADITEQLSWNTSSISSLNGSYSTIQGQLSLLASRLDELAEGEKLLSEHSVTAEAWEDGRGAVLTFTMTPRSWNENDTAYVAVRHDGTELERFECRWDGTACQSTVSVAARNGYEYYYAVCHADGTQEQELMDSGYRDIEKCLKGSFAVSVPDAEISNGSLIFHNFTLSAFAPTILRTDTIYLEKLEWVITVNGVEYCRKEISDHWGWEPTTNAQMSGSGLHKFTLPETAEGDVVLLSVEVSLSGEDQRRIDAVEFRRESGTWQRTAYAPVVGG